MIGVCIGSQNTCIGVLKGSNVDIILSETSSRSIPTVVSYTDKERVSGDAALSISKSNYLKTIVYPNRFLGQVNGPIFQQEKEYSFIEPKLDDYYRCCFDFNYKNVEERLTPEAIMGTFFNKIKKYWKNKGYNTNDLCVAIPDYYNVQERQAMLDAMNIAHLNAISLVNESSAISLNYGLFRRTQFEDTKPRLVGFVDMGQSKTSIFFSTYTKNNQKVVSVTTDRFLGGRDFDFALMEFFGNKFNNKYKCDVLKVPKLRLRMIEAISKMRKILTSNKETHLSIESLYDDEDLYENITRDEFHKIIEPFTQKFQALINIAIKNATDSKVNLKELHSVEMVGDCIRTPILQQIIKESFGFDVSKTLAPDEAVARGATLFAAMSSPYFSLKDFNFEHFNPYTIQFEYPFVKDGVLEIRNTKIISKGENVPNRKSIKFNEKQLPKQGMLELKLHLNKDEFPHMTDLLLKTYNIQLPSKLDEQYQFSLQFLQDTNGHPHIDKATIIETRLEDVPIVKKEEKKDVKKDEKKDEKKKDETPSTGPPSEANDTTMKDANTEEPKTEKKKVDHTTACTIKCIFRNYGMEKAVFDEAKKKEERMDSEDHLLNYAHDMRNDMEVYIYTTREKLENELAPYVTEQDKQTLLNIMNETKHWFESGHPDITLKSVIDEKNTALTGTGDRVYKRRNDWEQLDMSLNNFKGALDQNIKRIQVEYDKLTNKQATSLTNENVEELKKIVENYNDTLNNSTEKLAKALKYVDPPVSYEALNRHLKDFNDKVNKVFNDADKKVKDELKRLEKEKKERDEKERKDKEAAAKQNTTNTTTTTNPTTTTETAENKDKTKTGSEMEVD